MLDSGPAMSAEDMPPSLSPEEAERLASKITPSWEAPPMDEVEPEPPSQAAYQTPIVPAMHAETEPKLVAAEIRREAGARIPITSDLPTSPRTPEELATDDVKARLAAADAAANADATADATVRMPSMTDGLSDGDIMAADPVEIPGPPRAPAIGGPPPRKPPAATGNMIPYVPETDRTAQTGRSLKALSEDEIPVSSIGGGSKTKVFAIVGVVALLAFGGVFAALRSSGSDATPDTSAHAGSGMVQSASSKNDIPPPEALTAAPAATTPTPPTPPTPATPATRQQPEPPEPKKVAAAPVSPPVSNPAPRPPVAVTPPSKPGGGGGNTTKPATPPPAKPGGIVRDNPF